MPGKKKQEIYVLVPDKLLLVPIPKRDERAAVLSLQIYTECCLRYEEQSYARLCIVSTMRQSVTESPTYFWDAARPTAFFTTSREISFPSAGTNVVNFRCTSRDSVCE